MLLTADDQRLWVKLPMGGNSFQYLFSSFCQRHQILIGSLWFQIHFGDTICVNSINILRKEKIQLAIILCIVNDFNFHCVVVVVHHDVFSFV